jgi:hypothetical protein
LSRLPPLLRRRGKRRHGPGQPGRPFCLKGKAAWPPGAKLVEGLHPLQLVQTGLDHLTLKQRNHALLRLCPIGTLNQQPACFLAKLKNLEHIGQAVSLCFWLLCHARSSLIERFACSLQLKEPRQW